MTEVVTTANQNNFISRQEMLQWINECLKLNEKKIENLGTGAIFCQLFDLVYPGKVQMSKVNWKAKYENEFVANFKILQQAFDKLNINKPIDVNKLIRCKYQDNLEFLQWIRKYHDQFRKNVDKPYDAVARRNGAQIFDKDFPDKIASHPQLQIVQHQANSTLDNSINHSSKHNFSRHSNIKSQTHYIPSEQGKQMSHSCQSSISNLSIDHEYNQLDEADADKPYQPNSRSQGDNTLIERLKDERNFYFSKIQSIDQMLDNINEKNTMTVIDIKKFIKTILYSTQDQILTILDDATVTLTDKSLNHISPNQFESLEGLNQLKNEILSTDQDIKKSDKKQKKKIGKTFDSNQENKQNLLQAPQLHLFDNTSKSSNQGYRTPISSKYSQEHSLHIEDLGVATTMTVNQNGNNNVNTFQQGKSQQNTIPTQGMQNKKDQEPLYEIFINEENSSKNKKLVVEKWNKQQSLNISENDNGDLIKIQQVSQLQLSDTDVFELNSNLFQSQDEDLLGNLE